MSDPACTEPNKESADKHLVHSSAIARCAQAACACAVAGRAIAEEALHHVWIDVGSDKLRIAVSTREKDVIVYTRNAEDECEQANARHKPCGSREALRRRHRVACSRSDPKSGSIFLHR